MKAILPALLATLCASFAQEKLNLDDPKVRERIIAKAIDSAEIPLGYTGWFGGVIGWLFDGFYTSKHEAFELMQR